MQTPVRFESSEAQAPRLAAFLALKLALLDMPTSTGILIEALQVKIQLCKTTLPQAFASSHHVKASCPAMLHIVGNPALVVPARMAAPES